MTTATAAAMAAGGAEIELHGVTAGYGAKPVLADFSLRIPSGAFTAVIGGNGSGKSTLLKTMVGLLEPQRGEVLVDGEPPRRTRERIGYMPQTSEVDWNFPISVREVVAMGRYRFNWRWGPLARRSREAEEAFDLALETMDAVHLRERQISELSGGERKRVLIARALVREPRLLLLDEPAAALDAAADDALMEKLCDIASSGATVVIATHDLASVVDHYAHVVCMCDACVLAEGRPSQVLTEDVLRRTFGRELAIVSRRMAGGADRESEPLADDAQLYLSGDRELRGEGHPHGSEHARGA